MGWEERSRGRIFLVRWVDDVTRADVDAVGRSLEAFARSIEEDAIVVFVTGRDVNPLPDDARRGQAELVQRLSENVHMHIIIEGTGFKHAATRSVMMGILLMARPRLRVKVHGSLEEVGRSLPSRRDLQDFAKLVEQIRAAEGVRGIQHR